MAAALADLSAPRLRRMGARRLRPAFAATHRRPGRASTSSASGRWRSEGRYERFAFFPDRARHRRAAAPPLPRRRRRGPARAGGASPGRAPPCRACRRWNRCSSPATTRCSPPRRRSRYPLRPRRRGGGQRGADRRRGAGRLAGRRRAGQALIENPGPDNPVYRTANGGDDGNPEGAPHRPGADARPPARWRRSGRRRRRRRRSRAPYAISGNALPYLRASAGALRAFRGEAPTLLRSCRRTQASDGECGALRVRQSRTVRSTPATTTSHRRLPTRRAATRLAYAAIVLQSLRDLFQQQRRACGGALTGIQFARRRLTGATFLAGAGAAIGARPCRRAPRQRLAASDMV